MKVTPAALATARRAPADWFEGIVWQQPVVMAEAPARLQALLVSFEPGARTNWHTHPLGQTLYVVSGCGIAQSRDGAPVLIRAGDAVWFPPGEAHWHGAAPTTPMAHIAMQEGEDGRAVDWLEPVADAEYRLAAAALMPEPEAS